MEKALQEYQLSEDGRQPVHQPRAGASPKSLTVYEVFRVIDGVPLFLEAHLSRLRRSIGLAGRVFQPGDRELKRAIAELIYHNDLESGNVKLEVAWETKAIAEKGKFAAYIIPHTYPSEEQYHSGVALGLLAAERNNPNAKTEQKALRTRANALMAEHRWYEVLLVDRHNRITEGSRSNFFLVCAGEVLTPPARSVLPGITRSIVIHLCQQLGLPFCESELPRTWINDAEAAFLTGTSPGVLPVAQIGDKRLPPDHPWLLALKQAYDRRVAVYIQAKKSGGIEGWE